MSSNHIVVDFVARGTSADEWRMVLVEQGPWNGSIDDQLRRVQERLYGCVDAALEGQLAQQFPESTGKKIVIQLDCYDLPQYEISEFFGRFSSGVFAVPDYRDALEKSKFVEDISFEVTFDAVH
jgi:hypothetical protein